jgi:hypothetical protein
MRGVRKALTLSLSRAAGEGTERHRLHIPSPAAREREGPAALGRWEGEGLRNAGPEADRPPCP